MLNNPYFWAGELGLLLTLISCLVLMHTLRHQPLLATGTLWFMAIMALNMLVRPIIVNHDHTIPPSPYLFRLAVGLVFASRVWFYLRSEGKSKDPSDVRMGNNILRWGAVAGTVLLTYIYYKLRSK